MTIETIPLTQDHGGARESDFDMSPRMRARAAEFILGQPFTTLPPISQASEQFAENAKNLKPLEFRPRDDGKFDEIVARFRDGMSTLKP